MFNGVKLAESCALAVLLGTASAHTLLCCDGQLTISKLHNLILIITPVGNYIWTSTKCKDSIKPCSVPVHAPPGRLHCQVAKV